MFLILGTSVVQLIISAIINLSILLPLGSLWAVIYWFVFGGKQKHEAVCVNFQALRAQWINIIQEQCEHPVHSEKVLLRNKNITLECVFAGPEDGEVLVFSHGFPESWLSWRHQITFFANKGYRVVAYDMRGYGHSTYSKSTGDYILQNVSNDLSELIDIVLQDSPHDKATIIGHDWGAAVTYGAAGFYPHNIKRVITMNLPHPVAFKDTLKTFPINVKQLLMSYYILLFNIPYVADIWLTVFSKRFHEHIMYPKPDPVFNNRLLKEMAQCYYNIPSKPTIWYRMLLRNGLFRIPPASEDPPTIYQPLLLIWGCKDIFLCEEGAYIPLKHVPNGRVRKIRGGDHFVQQTEYDEVNRVMLDFLQEDSE